MKHCIYCLYALQKGQNMNSSVILLFFVGFLTLFSKAINFYTAW